MLTVKSRAICPCESCQVWKEAALSKSAYVPWGSLARANCLGYVYEGVTKAGRTGSTNPTSKHVEAEQKREAVIAFFATNEMRVDLDL